MRVRGYTLLEYMLVLVLMIVGGAIAIPIVNDLYGDMQESEYVQLLQTTVTIARRNYEQSTSYTGLTTNEIIPQLPPKWVMGGTSIRHPLSGYIGVAADGSDPTLMLLTVSVQRDDTCRRALLGAWPYFDRIWVDITAVKTSAGQSMPSEATLAARCTATTHNILIQTD